MEWLNENFVMVLIGASLPLSMLVVMLCIQRVRERVDSLEWNRGRLDDNYNMLRDLQYEFKGEVLEDVRRLGRSVSELETGRQHHAQLLTSLDRACDGLRELLRDKQDLHIEIEGKMPGGNPGIIRLPLPLVVQKLIDFNDAEFKLNEHASIDCR